MIMDLPLHWHNSGLTFIVIMLYWIMKRKKPNPHPPKQPARYIAPKRRKVLYVPTLSVSSYYEDKPLTEVCGGLCVKEPSIFEKIKDEPEALRTAQIVGSVALANNTTSPRDLPDDWKQEIKLRR